MTHQEFDKRLDKELDWQVHLIVREAVMQGVSANNKDLKITEEMLKQAKAESKQAIRELFEEYRTTITGKEGGE